MAKPIILTMGHHWLDLTLTRLFLFQIFYFSRERKWKLHDILAIIVTPTRELAIQIDEVLLLFTKQLSFLRYKFERIGISLHCVQSVVVVTILCTSIDAGKVYSLVGQIRVRLYESLRKMGKNKLAIACNEVLKSLWCRG